MITNMFTLLATVLLLVPTVLGLDLEKRCEEKEDLCLLSFVWCNWRDNSRDCSLPDDTYPRSTTNNVEYPIILADTNYTIKWKSTKGKDGPVTFKWGMENLTWETAVTGTKFRFNPSEIISSFPTDKYPNASPADAWYGSTRFPMNIITITRAEVNQSEGVTESSDFSDQFLVQSGIAIEYLETQRKLEYNKWKLRVGLSVGLGVPVLLIITALTTWLLCKARMQKLVQKPMELNTR
ncbi:hypothetical protein NPX13_g1099 [Xylaria arbuscula]|uniref:Uncharacterized protein n=1 Tax=Xylaria arbuscula TaxID=114810 RepID=A0A9W8NMP2_9PEZI|nr:hypothetical protein NPX13_g1099 [Xylaria arbuscula]